MKPLKESQTEHCKAGQLNRVMASLDAALPAASTEYTGKYQPMGLSTSLKFCMSEWISATD
jgi:hypothetical protein